MGSLNIKIQRNVNPKTEFEDKIHIAEQFFKFFSDIIKYKNSQLVILHKDFDSEIKLNKCDLANVNTLIKLKGIEKHIESIAIEIEFKIGNNVGSIDINSRSDSRQSADIIIDIYSNKIDGDYILSFSDLMLNNIISSDKLDLFFNDIRNKKLSFQKAFIEVFEGDDPFEIEDGSNPLNYLYLYDLDKTALFRNPLRAMKYLADEDDEVDNIYEKMKGTDHNILVADLYDDEVIRNQAITFANQHGVKAEISSFKFVSKTQEGVKKYYLDLIKKLYGPIFNQVPSLKERISKVSQEISSSK